MAQPFIAQQQQPQPSPIDMMTGPQPPQQAYAPVQPYPNQPYPAQPYPNQPYPAQPYPNQPVYMPGQPVPQVYPQGQPQQQQLYGGYPVVAQAAYVQMPAACPAMGVPVTVQQGATKDIARMPYMFSLLCVTGVCFLVGCAFFVAGIASKFTVAGFFIGFGVCSAFSIFFACFNQSSIIEFDKQSKMMHVTTHSLLLHFCPTRFDLPFTTPINVTLHDTGVSSGSSHHHHHGFSTYREGRRYFTIRLLMQGHEVDVARGDFYTLSGRDGQWKYYLNSLGINAM